MAVIQNECYRVVTIAYLKKFIKDGNTYLIQNSSGGNVDVNLNALAEANRRDDYCPTYAELTGGSLIPTWQAGTTANGDRDGIIVSSSAILGGNYATNQLVDQSDLSLEYTRFSGLTISATKTSFSECSGETSVSFTHKYIRRTKKMANCPTTPEGITYTTSSADTSDTACSELTWHTTYGSVTNCNTYKIPKNGSTSSNARTDSVYASIVFRGGTQNSNTLSMNQAALTGDYTYEISGSDTTVKKKLINITPTPSSQKVYGTNSNETCTVYSAVALAGTGVYDLYRDFYWVDSCGEVYKDNAHRRTKLVTSDLEEPATSDSYTFNYSTGCCDTSSTQTKELTVRYGTSAESRTFSAICESCTCVHCDCNLVVLDPVSPSAHDSSNKKRVAKYSSSECEGSWSIQLVGGDSSIFYDFEFASDGYLYAANYANTGVVSRSATYRGTIGTCSKTITLTQEGYDTPPSCAEIVLDGDRHHSSRSAEYEYDSSRITNNGRFGVWVYYDVPESVINSRAELNDYVYTHTAAEEYYSNSKFDTAGPITVSLDSYSGSTKTSQCVTARLQYLAALARGEATISDLPGCITGGCDFNDYVGHPCPDATCYNSECRDSGQKCNLGRFYDPDDDYIEYVRYDVTRNDSGRNRLSFIFWYPAGGAALPQTCPSARVAFLQDA